MGSILITGASSGIGKAVFNILKGQHDCILVARREHILKELTCDQRRNHRFVSCDFENPTNIINLFNYIEHEKIELAGFIHCAGISPVLSINQMTIAEIEKTINVNLFSFVEICKIIFSYDRRESDFRIIAVSSIAADRASERQIIYNASKAALNSAIISFAQAGIKEGINVNGIALGACDTEMLSAMQMSKEFRSSLLKHYPRGIISPDVVAKIICNFLAKEYINMTGSIIKIDSGFSVVH